MNIDMLKPAKNGLHNVALDFVRRKLFDIPNPINIFNLICNNNLVLG